MIEWVKRFRLLVTALLFLLLAFLVLTLEAKEEQETFIAERAILRISFPVQKKAQGMMDWLRGIKENYISLTLAQKENQDLRRLVATLRAENNRLQEALLAQGRIEKLYPLQDQHPAFSVIAHVFAHDPSNWFKTVLVDRGEKDGISKDMAVISAAGVVGRVIKTSPNTAKVLLITDPNSAVDVIVQRSRAQGIMEGKREETCILKYVQKSDDVQLGDHLITSGLGGIFPKGLRIGTVTKVEHNRPGIFQYVEVSPAADLSRLEEILILGEEP